MICSWTQRALAMGFSNSESHPAGFEDASLDLSTCLTMKSSTRSLEKPTIDFSRCLSKKSLREALRMAPFGLRKSAPRKALFADTKV